MYLALSMKLQGRVKHCAMADLYCPRGKVVAENGGTGLPLERRRHYHADLLLIRVEQYAILMGGIASSAFHFLASVYLQLFP